jgi:ABC-type multidrug transport system fused ATPase/permease subunit
VGLAALTACDFGQMWVPLLVGGIIDTLAGGHAAASGIGRQLSVIVCLAGGVAVMRYSWRNLIYGFSTRLEKELRARLYARFVQLPVTWHNRNSSGDLMALATNDIESVRLAVGFGLVSLVDSIVLGTAAVVFMLSISPRLCLWAFIPLPLITVLTAIFGRRIFDSFLETQNLFGNLTEAVCEHVSGFKVIRAMALEELAKAEIDREGVRYMRRNVRLSFVMGLFFPFLNLLTNLAVALTLFFGGRAAIMGEISPGDFVAFLSYLGLLAWPLMAMGLTLGLIQQGLASLARLSRVLLAEENLPHPPDRDPRAVGRAVGMDERFLSAGHAGPPGPPSATDVRAMSEEFSRLKVYATELAWLAPSPEGGAAAISGAGTAATSGTGMAEGSGAAEGMQAGADPNGPPVAGKRQADSDRTLRAPADAFTVKDAWALSEEISRLEDSAARLCGLAEAREADAPMEEAESADEAPAAPDNVRRAPRDVFSLEDARGLSLEFSRLKDYATRLAGVIAAPDTEEGEAALEEAEATLEGALEADTFAIRDADALATRDEAEALAARDEAEALAARGEAETIASRDEAEALAPRKAEPFAAGEAGQDANTPQSALVTPGKEPLAAREAGQVPDTRHSARATAEKRRAHVGFTPGEARALSREFSGLKDSAARLARLAEAQERDGARAEAALADARRLSGAFAAASRMARNVPAPPPSVPRLLKGGFSIAFERVSYTYPDRKEKALSGFSAQLDPRGFTALTGPTGSGKSTLASLLPALLEPDEGRILIDGRPSTEYRLEDLRSLFGLVPQEGHIFTGTLLDNIRFGRPGATEAQALEAAEAAGLRMDPQVFPEGLLTRVGEKGITLSGGQRQRAALARALLADPPYLILDDTLSAVDANIEEEILNTLVRVREGRGTLVVSHRVTSLKRAGTFLVLEKGELTASGDFRELTERPGYFKRIVDLAYLGERLADAEKAAEEAAREAEAHGEDFRPVNGAGGRADGASPPGPPRRDVPETAVEAPPEASVVAPPEASWETPPGPRAEGGPAGASDMKAGPAKGRREGGDG